MSLIDLLQTVSRKPHSYRPFQYGHRLVAYQNTIPAQAKIALLVWAKENADFLAVREALYELAANFGVGEVVDFGNVRGGRFGLAEATDQILQHQLFPIILTDQPEAISAAIEAQRNNSLEVSLIDSHLSAMLPLEQAPAPLNALEQILRFYPTQVFHCNTIGYQSYYADEQLLDWLQEHHHTAYRLSAIRAQLEEVEPIVRDSDICYFNLPAIRSGDAPATAFANPNGFSAEEACRIVRYAAMSDRLSCLVVGGYKSEIADYQQTARLLAQMVWFAIEGFKHRKHEYPLDTRSLTKYMVESRWVDFPLVFFKSPRSERWWFWVPLPEESRPDNARHQWVACSYADYQKACEGELPQRLLDAYRRFE